MAQRICSQPKQFLYTPLRDCKTVVKSTLEGKVAQLVIGVEASTWLQSASSRTQSIGHTARVCRKAKTSAGTGRAKGSKAKKSGAPKPHKANAVVIDDSFTVHTIFKLGGGRNAATKPLLVTVKVEGKYSLQMEVDTCASVSLISEVTLKKDS